MSESFLFELPTDPQQIFSIVKKHAQKKEKSQGSIRTVGVIEYGCKYRGPNGAKCFAGILIPDEVWDDWFENKPWSLLIGSYGFPPQHWQLIQALQFLHDFEEVKQWDSGFSAIARRFGLKNQ